MKIVGKKGYSHSILQNGRKADGDEEAVAQVDEGCGSGAKGAYYLSEFDKFYNSFDRGRRFPVFVMGFVCVADIKAKSSYVRHLLSSSH